MDITPCIAFTQPNDPGILLMYLLMEGHVNDPGFVTRI